MLPLYCSVNINIYQKDRAVSCNSSNLTYNNSKTWDVCHKYYRFTASLRFMYRNVKIIKPKVSINMKVQWFWNLDCVCGILCGEGYNLLLNVEYNKI